MFKNKYGMVYTRDEKGIIIIGCMLSVFGIGLLIWEGFTSLGNDTDAWLAGLIAFISGAFLSVATVLGVALRRMSQLLKK